LQIEPIVVAAIGVISAVVAAVLTALLGEWRVRKAEVRAHDRAHDAEANARNLEAIRQTRLRAEDTVERLKGAAISGVYNRRSLGMFDGGDDQLIGDAEAARAYRELLVELQRHLGRGLTTDLSRRASRTLSQVGTALRNQEDRVRRGEGVTMVPSNVADELFDMDAFGDRLLSIDAPPSFGGRIRRGAVDALAWWQAFRNKDHHGPSDP
jgi:hypothetical protein